LASLKSGFSGSPATFHQVPLMARNEIGRRTESVHQRYHIVSGKDLTRPRKGLTRLARA
jgi:hypothetical protein